MTDKQTDPAIMEDADIFVDKEKERSLKKIGTALGAAAVLIVSANTADAVDELAGDIFIHTAGYIVKLGPILSLETGLDDPKMKVVFIEVDDDGNNPKELKGEISRELFTGLLKRTEYGEWSINTDDWLEIVNKADLNPPTMGRGGNIPDYTFQADFHDMEYHPCKFDKAKGLKSLMTCRKEGTDGNAYVRLAGLADLKAQNSELDKHISEQGERIEKKKIGKAEIEKADQKVVEQLKTANEALDAHFDGFRPSS